MFVKSRVCSSLLSRSSWLSRSSGLRGGLVNNGLGSGFRGGLIDDGSRLVNNGSRLVDNRSGLVDNGCGSGFVSGSGGGLVSVVFGLSFIRDISDETRVTINLVHNTLETTVGKLDSVFAVGLVSVAVLFVVEVLVVVAFLVVHVIAEVVKGGYVGVGWGGIAGLVGQGDSGKGKDGNKGLKIDIIYWTAMLCYSRSKKALFEYLHAVCMSS